MKFDEKSDPATIIRDGNVDRLVEVAQDAGSELVRMQLTTSQIRNVFGEVRAIEMNWNKDPERSFRRTVLLQPKLAYAAARDTGNKARGVRALVDILTACIGEVQRAPVDKRRSYFLSFVDLFEAILAYHKQAGGKS